MPKNFIPGFEHLKDLLKKFGCKKHAEVIHELKEQAKKEDLHEFKRVIKHIFQQIAEKVNSDDNPAGWKAFHEMLTELSAIMPSLKVSLAVASNMDATKKKKYLMDIVLHQEFIHNFSKYLLDAIHPENKWQRQDVRDERTNYITNHLTEESQKYTDIVQNQLHYSFEGRLASRIFNLFYFIIDIFCVEIGLPFSLLGDHKVKPQVNKNNNPLGDLDSNDPNQNINDLKMKHEIPS